MNKPIANIIFILIISITIINCSNLERRKVVDIESYSDTCITLRPHFSCTLKPLKSIKTFVRQFEQIKHEYEISLFSGFEYNLISKLQHLYKDIKRQEEIFEYNWQIIASRIDNYNNQWAAFQNPNEGIFLRNKSQKYTNYAPEFKDMRHNMLMLIEKLTAIKKLSNKIKFRKERKEKTLKALKIYSI